MMFSNRGLDSGAREAGARQDYLQQGESNAKR